MTDYIALVAKFRRLLDPEQTEPPVFVAEVSRSLGDLLDAIEALIEQQDHLHDQCGRWRMGWYHAQNELDRFRYVHIRETLSNNSKEI